jgi:hypothetical protein
MTPNHARQRTQRERHGCSIFLFQAKLKKS